MLLKVLYNNKNTQLKKSIITKPIRLIKYMTHVAYIIYIKNMKLETKSNTQLLYSKRQQCTLTIQDPCLAPGLPI